MSVLAQVALQHQAREALGVLDRQHLAHRAAGGIAAPMHLVEAQRVDQLQGVVGHLPDAVVDARERAAAGAAMIVHDDRELAGKLGHIFAPPPAVATQTRHQQERRSAAVLFEVKLRTVAQFDMWHL